MSLFSIATAVCNNIGVTPPTSIIGNTDPAATRLLQMARREGNVLSTRTNWVSLVVEHVFFANGSSDYALPADFRSMIDDTLWDRTRFWKMRGAMSPQQWQLYKSSIIGRATIERRWRIRLPSGASAGAAGVFSIDPLIGTTDTTSKFVFEYVSKNWCQSTTVFELAEAELAAPGTGYAVGQTITASGGVATTNAVMLITSLVAGTTGVETAEIVTKGVFPSRPASPMAQLSTSGTGTGATFTIDTLTMPGLTTSDWVADTDTALLDEDLIELGVIWRTLRRLGLAYDEELNEYKNQVDQSVARDGGTAVLGLVPNSRIALLSPLTNVQEGNFPG